MNKQFQFLNIKSKKLFFCLVFLGASISAYAQSISIFPDSVKIAFSTVETQEVIPNLAAIQVKDSAIIITFSDGSPPQEIAYTPGTPMQTTDAAGNRYTIDKDGKATQEYNAADAPDPLSADATVYYDYVFEQGTAGKGGFDDYADAPVALSKYYEYTTINDKQYMLSWKAVATNQSDQVTIKSTKGDFPTTVGFKLTPEGGESKPMSAQNGSTTDKKTLSLLGGYHQQLATLSAYVVKQDDNNTKTEIDIAALKVMSYSVLQKKVTIIPVNELSADQSSIATTLNNIYAQAITEWQVTVQSYTADATMIQALNEGESGAFTQFTPGMKAFNKAYKNAHPTDKDTYYIFLVKGSNGLDGHQDRQGYMPFNRQYGYIFMDNLNDDLGTVIAHELGHGAFKLEHPESEFGTTLMKDNLMSESATGTHLRKYQWDNIHDPLNNSGWLKDDEESGYEAAVYFVDWKEEQIILHTSQLDAAGNATYITPAGKPFLLPKTAKPSFTGLIKDSKGNIVDLGLPRGVLQAFSQEGEIYAANYTKNTDNIYFNGYKLYGSTSDFKEIATPNRIAHKVILGKEDQDCRLTIFTADFSYNLAVQTAYKGAGSTIKSINATNLNWRDDDKIFLEDCFPDYWAEWQTVTLEEFENTVSARYNHYGFGGVLYKTTKRTYLYSNLDTEGNVIYFQWAGNQWKPWVPPNPDCWSCELREMFTPQFIFGLFKETGHTTLDVVGVIPGLGEPADALNGIWYTIEGDATNATLSFAATVPVIGWVSTGGKWVLKARRIGKISKEGGKFVLKYGDDIAKLTDKVSDLGFTDEMVAALEKDLKDPSFFEALIKNNDLIDSWKLLHKSGVDDVLRKNISILENSNYIIKSSTLKFGKQSMESLAAMTIKKNGRLEEIITNLKYFEKHTGNTGANQILANLIKEGTFEANAFALKALKRSDEIPGLLKGTVDGFEVIVDPARKFTVDILTKNGNLKVFNELKSWNNFSGVFEGQFTKQFSNYLNNIEDLGQLKYLFEGKGRYIKTSGNFDAAKGFLKSDITKALKNNKDELISSLGNNPDKMVKLFGDTELSDDLIDLFVEKNFTKIFEVIY